MSRSSLIPTDNVADDSPRQLRALVEYDGTNYYGFQIQASRPTIQRALEEVLARVLGERVRIRYAGRTDTGVHALGQVIAFRATWRHGLTDLERALNALLPPDIAVRRVEWVDDPQFHPRYSARSRVYRYTVWNAPWRSPLVCRFAHHEPRPLDVDRMNEAAQLLLGEHDFAAFGQATHGDVTVRYVYAAGWRRWDGAVPGGVVAEQRWLVFDIEANAFLRRMVRTIVSTLLEVGKGMRSVDSVAQLLAQRDRALAAPPAAACGLSLIEVKY